MKDYRSLSLWLDNCGDDLTPRPSLPGDREADVCIVGAGYTGLWTAYYLLKADPSLRVVVLEKEIAGHGASGRNGGWCSALFAAPRDKLAHTGGRGAALAMQRAMFETVDEVGRVVRAEGIDAHFTKGGTLTAATTRAHVPRLKAEIAEERRWGFSEDDYRWLSAAQLSSRVLIEGSLGAAFTPHCAALHPARLSRGLARSVEGRGATIHELTAVRSIDNGLAMTNEGRVKAEVVVRATEGYTVSLEGLKRTLLPIYSLMIATEPLPSSFWDEVGWARRETVTDARHLIIYAQRTADDRIAIGGRGAPYHFGSDVRDSYERVPGVFSELQRVLVALWPGARDAAITHKWGGPLGVPRDWFSSVGYDRGSGLAWAGGYVGDGVATANLAGRTLADLILGRDTDLTKLPWVGHRSPLWEPEPLRWLGTNLALQVMASADRAELRSGRPARRAAAVARLTGIH
ncbi:MAG: FAD-binding oxidoreductase [Actinomycetota bacterium]|nr:FAD-binding oxidoreductase [Actinomycetota bacterium]